MNTLVTEAAMGRLGLHVVQEGLGRPDASQMSRGRLVMSLQTWAVTTQLSSNKSGVGDVESSLDSRSDCM